MLQKSRFSTLSLILTTLFVLPVAAEDTEPHAAGAPGMEEMMAAMEEARKPGEHHAFLASMEGEWTFTNTMWMDPSQPPIKTDGKSTKKMILGGRYLQEEVAGEAMGRPFKGQGVTGFDNTAGEFVGTWIDDMATSVAVFRGRRANNTLTMYGDYLDPLSKQKMQVRAVTKKVDEDHHVFEYFMTVEGAPEFKSMEIDYRRAAGN